MLRNKKITGNNKRAKQLCKLVKQLKSGKNKPWTANISFLLRICGLNLTGFALRRCKF